MSSLVKLYVNNDANETLPKTLTPVTYNGDKTFNCDIVEPCSVITPTIIVGKHNVDFAQINYCFIDTFQRYYFIENYEIISNGMVKLYLSVDAMQSWSDGILALSPIIARQEDKSLCTNTIEDNYVTSRIDRQISKKHVGNVGGNPSGEHIVITVTGGSSNG